MTEPDAIEHLWTMSPCEPQAQGQVGDEGRGQAGEHTDERGPDSQAQTATEEQTVTELEATAPFRELPNVSGSGNIVVSNAPGSVFNIYQYHPSSKDGERPSEQCGAPPQENKQGTSEKPKQESTQQSTQAEVQIPDKVLFKIAKELPHWEELALNLEFSDADLSRFKGDYPDRAGYQAYKMLIAWKQKQAAHVDQIDALGSALGEAGRRDLSVILRGSTLQTRCQLTEGTDTQCQDCVGRCEKALKSLYMSTGSYVQLIPWINGLKKHIMDIYTKPKLETESYSGEVLESYDGIFRIRTREGEAVHIAVVNGLAGRGKSTLFDKMAYDWAVGCSDALRKFKLVFLLKMHALEQSSDLIDAVFDQLLAKDTMLMKHALREFVRRNPGQVLLLLDGFDEFLTTSPCTSAYGSVLNILKRDVCRGCSVLVNTRPSHFHKLVTRELVQEPYTYIRIVGFSAHDVDLYVKKFFSDNDRKALGLLSKIQSSNLLTNLAESPMLLLLMCLLWRDASTLPDTMSHLYSEAAKYIFNRKETVTKEQVAKIVSDIGKAGMHGLLSPKQVLSFKEGDFEKGVVDVAVRAGILTRQRVVKGLDAHISVQFIHKTFQEFCSGRYLQSLFVQDRGEFQRILRLMVPKGPEGLGYILRFCCGDSEACTNEILQIFQDSCQKYLSFDSRLGQLALHCYFEGQSSSLPPGDVIHSFITANVIIRDLDSDCFNSITYFLERVASQTKESGNAFLSKVKKLHASQSALIRCGEGLAVAMSAMANLYYVCLKDKWSKWGFSQTVVLEGKANLWCYHLRQVRNLQRLNLSRCALKGEDVKHVTALLRELPKLFELNISFNDLGGTAATWCKLLEQGQCLKRLDLSRCSLKGMDVQLVVDSLRGLPKLDDLDLSDNDLGGSAALWCVHLTPLQQLQQLNLRNCSLLAQDVELVAQSLGNLPNLVELILSENDLRDSAFVWCSHLAQLQQLQQLNLRRCSLTEQDIKSVIVPLRKLPQLHALNLSENDLGGVALSLCEHFKQLQNLKRLNLVLCRLSMEDKEHITKSLSELSERNRLVINF
ncbi:NACHT, LRR and PYD domains-containing protein 3-like isoform X2 [Acanthaster planci]|uniref:NACHT, LRR and PYD domains-containing protein 3-like isoform X2 n=1 Tax=Acanthaster planci TaxID=133434 RepID=A0A8B8A1P0_ACAPL|nr:NACHT, LRR and PYD domains-containing protein 3-like isoform X2 [Acanthaster planci]